MTKTSQILIKKVNKFLKIINCEQNYFNKRG